MRPGWALGALSVLVLVVLSSFVAVPASAADVRVDLSHIDVPSDGFGNTVPEGDINFEGIQHLLRWGLGKWRTAGPRTPPVVHESRGTQSRCIHTKRQKLLAAENGARSRLAAGPATCKGLSLQPPSRAPRAFSQRIRTPMR